MFIGKYNKSVIITYIGVILSFCGMMFVYQNEISYGMICLIFAGICDLFDGKVARMCKRNEEEKEFGKQLDSMADVFSFLAFPSVLGIVMLEKWMYPVLILYILAGIIRLSWFHITTKEEGNQTHYFGLPVTYAALILPILYVIRLLANINGTYLFSVGYFIIAVLFVLNVKIPKPKGIWYVIFSVMAVIVTGIIFVIGT